MFGIALFQLTELKSALEEQKKVELRHLGEIALGIASEEQAAAQRGEVTDEQAKMRAAARIGTLRYGGDEYFWINDLEPRMIMHPIKPELNGTNISGTKDPDGKALFVEAVEVVKRQASSNTNGRSPVRPTRSRRYPSSGVSSPGAGSSGLASTSTSSEHKSGRTQNARWRSDRS
jgi:hypothetical protein